MLMIRKEGPIIKEVTHNKRLPIIKEYSLSVVSEVAHNKRVVIIKVVTHNKRVLPYNRYNLSGPCSRVVYGDG